MAIVYFVGAGPGDPSLITMRGRQCLAAADVVVYDHLVHPRILRAAPAHCERIDAGAASPQPLQQEAISYLLADKAREGKIVVRLKWGDPFLFDDGAKEALFLREQGVPFEVVPGIPAGLAGPTYAGVPITYPGGADTVTFVRGYENEASELPALDWGRLARLGGTVVCYTAVSQLADIVQALVSHGRSRTEPAALIYSPTLPDQYTVHGTLEQIATTAHDGHRRAAILITGNVAGFREHLRWFDARPLFGKRILVTRSREQAGELVDRLEVLGAQAIEAPTIRIVPTDEPDRLTEVCTRAREFDWVVFTSANGVDRFMRHLLDNGGDVRDLAGVRLCAIGPATAEKLNRYGMRVDVVPTEYRAEAVADVLRGTGELKGLKVLLPRADIAREVLAEELRKEGADVTEVAAYRTVLDGGELDIYRMLLEKQLDVVTFTSASTVRNFVKNLGAEAAADLLQTTEVACIGPVTAEAAQQLGIRTTIMPSTYTIPALVDAIVQHFLAAASRE